MRSFINFDTHVCAIMLECYPVHKSARRVFRLAGSNQGDGKRIRDMERSRSYSGNVPSNGSVKIGGLWKRSQGLSRFTRPNYRHRVFILTENAISYYSGTVDVSIHSLHVWTVLQPF